MSNSQTSPQAGEAAVLRWRGPRGLTLGDLLFVVACVLAVAVLLFLGRYTTFFNDEWSFIVDRSTWSFDALMRPHNEHWSLTPAIVYNVLFATVGLRSYLPYLLILMAVHVAAASAVYVLLRHHNGQLPALAGGTLLLFLGTGEDNLFWAFQMAFLGAAAAGAWAIVLLLTRQSRRAAVTAAALLLVAVATSGTGLFFLVAAAVMLVLDPVRRRRLWVVVPASAAYLAWYLALGSTAIGAHRDPFTLAGLQQVPGYVVTGASYAIGRLSGWGEQVGLVLFVLMGLATAWHVSGSGPIRSAAVAGFTGLIAQLVLTGLVRAQLGVVQATSSRYVYIASMLLLITTAGWIGSRFAELRVRPVVVLGAVFALALGANLSALPSGRDAYVERAQATRASIIVIDRYGGSPAVPDDAGLFPIPGKERLDEIRDRLGLPLEDAILPDAPPPDPSVLDAHLFALVAGAFTDSVTDELPPTEQTPRVAASTDVTLSATSGCIELVVVGPNPQVQLPVAGGNALAIERDRFGELRAYLALHAPPNEASSRPLAVAPGTVHLIQVPDVGEERPWTVRVDVPVDAASTRVCVVAGSGS